MADFNKLSSDENRLQSVDLLRGAMMVLMALDHVRVYSGLPAGGSDAGIFFTRWVTHFCAPGFAFLAGTAAFLVGMRSNNPALLARYLLKRGLLLVVLELTLIRFLWTFNLNLAEFMLAGVIWMLGWCMVLLALLVRLRLLVVGGIGLVIVIFQQLFAQLPHWLPASIRDSIGWCWEFIYPADLPGLAGISILYVLVPWIGVMAAGYGFGALLMLDPARRRRFCLRIGLAFLLVFLVIGSVQVFSEPSAAAAPPFLFRLLNQRKYPASTLYLLMTLGPLIALVPWAEKARGWLVRVLVMFGRVPLFYYLMHILIIHLSALVVNLILWGNTHGEWYERAPFVAVPEEYRWNLAILYLVFSLDVLVLYLACRWYSVYVFANWEKTWLKLM